MTTEIMITDKITVRPIQSVGGDHMVIAAARTSVSGESALEYADPAKAEESAGLIGYLMKCRHGSPFEHSSMTFFVHAPIFVWREWHRHRIGFSYSESSGRYRELDPVFWVPRLDRPIVPVENYKPARPQFVANPATAEFARGQLKWAYQQAYASYTTMLDAGVAKEVARACLPVGIYSSCWVTTNPRALMAFLSLRTHESTAAFPSYPQAEIEQAARVAESFLEQGWPLTYRAFCTNGRVAP